MCKPFLAQATESIFTEAKNEVTKMQLEFARQREAEKAEMQKEVLAAKAEAAVERAKLEGDARCAQVALDAQRTIAQQSVES